MGRKQCGKRKNCSLRAISPFPTVFSKTLVLQARKKKKKTGLVWERVNDLRKQILCVRCFIEEWAHYQRHITTKFRWRKITTSG